MVQSWKLTVTIRREDMDPYGRSAVQTLHTYGELRGGSILSLLLENLQDPSPRVRALAAREISDYTTTFAVERLLDIAAHDPECSVRCAAIRGLGNHMYLGSLSDYDLQSDEDLACVEDCLTDDDFERVYAFLVGVAGDERRSLDERRYAVESLSFTGDETVEAMIAELYARPEKRAKVSALVAMGASGAVRWVEVLRRELSNPDPELQVEAIHAAGDLGIDSLGKELWQLTYAADREIALAAIWALGQTGWDGAFERLDELTLHADSEISACADEAMDEWLFYNGLAQEHDDEDIDLFLAE
jgi:HEAT repeat protein